MCDALVIPLLPAWECQREQYLARLRLNEAHDQNMTLIILILMRRHRMAPRQSSTSLSCRFVCALALHATDPKPNHGGEEVLKHTYIVPLPCLDKASKACCLSTAEHSSNIFYPGSMACFVGVCGSVGLY